MNTISHAVPNLHIKLQSELKNFPPLQCGLLISIVWVFAPT
jgi:hypothetical protein